MSEPDRVLIAAGAEALRPFVRSLRKMGWAAEITVHVDPLKVTLDIDLSGLKRPQETDPE